MNGEHNRCLPPRICSHWEWHCRTCGVEGCIEYTPQDGPVIKYALAAPGPDHAERSPKCIGANIIVQCVK